MKRAAAIFAGVVWFGLVFFVTWRVTFPSQSVADRAAVEVDRATNGQYQLAMSNVRPWWTGVAADNVVLSEVSRKRGDAPPVKTPVFAFETARLKAGVISLIRNKPRVIGAVKIAGSDLDFDITAGMNKRGTQLVPRFVNISSQAFPVQDLAGMLGTEIHATGGLDLLVDVAAEEGMRDAAGDIKISGRNILITAIDPELTGGMDLGMEIPIDEIDIHFEVVDGKATVRTGRIESKLLDTKIDGDVTLREDIQRSTLDLGFALTLGDELQMFKGFLKRAEWEDGTFHYRCSGSFGRPSCREDPERGGRASRGSTAAGSSTGANAGRRTRPTESTPRSTLSDEEREQRRQEALERLRKNRERRTQAAADGGTEDEHGQELEEVGYVEDEEDLPDEEDLAPEEEVPLDGEPIYDDQ